MTDPYADEGFDPDQLIGPDDVLPGGTAVYQTGSATPVQVIPDPEPLIADVTGHQEQTLVKVRAGLLAASFSDEAATHAISEMQNQGVLFRERVENPDADGMTDGSHAGSPNETEQEIVRDAQPEQGDTCTCKGSSIPHAPGLRGCAKGPDDKPILIIDDPAAVSDGYHTMGELYEHRRALTAVLATIGAIQDDAWRTKAHHPDDNPIYDGYFLVGIELPDGPVSYHYPLAHWDEFSAVPEVEHAPRWDGHTADDVVERLYGFVAVLAHAVAERDASDAEEAASAEHPPKPCDCDVCRCKRAREEAQANAAEMAATEAAPAE